MQIESSRPFLKALYPVGVLLLFASVAEPLVRIWPLRVTEVGWRFGAAGLVSNASAGVLFGLVWIMGVAVLLEHRRTLRFMSALVAILALGALAVLVLFALDFLQLRSLVNPNLQGGFDVAALQAMVTLGLVIPVSIGLGVGGWVSARETSRPRTQEKAGSILIHSHAQGGSTA